MQECWPRRSTEERLPRARLSCRHSSGERVKATARSVCVGQSVVGRVTIAQTVRLQPAEPFRKGACHPHARLRRRCCGHIRPAMQASGTIRMWSTRRLFPSNSTWRITGLQPLIRVQQRACCLAILLLRCYQMLIRQQSRLTAVTARALHGHDRPVLPATGEHPRRGHSLLRFARLALLTCDGQGLVQHPWRIALRHWRRARPAG